MGKKKIIIRSILSIILVGYSIFIVPGQASTVFRYYKLKNQVNTLNLELQALAGSLLPAKDIDTVIRNSGYKIKLCTIMDSMNTDSVSVYTGEDLSDDKTKVLEYIIETKDDVNYLLSYLSGYHISYSSIVLSENELVLQIYCS